MAAVATASLGDGGGDGGDDTDDENNKITTWVEVANFLKCTLKKKKKEDKIKKS